MPLDLTELRRPRNDDDRVYPCAHKGCKVMRSKNEGGTTFTVCDKHWDEHWAKHKLAAARGGRCAVGEKPRAIAADELRDRFMGHVRALVKYWQNETRSNADERVSGVAFSILSTLDGSSPGIPSFDLVARPHPDDKAYHIEANENWIEDGTVINADCMLHELFHKGDT